jgi:hypothetical protein
MWLLHLIWAVLAHPTVLIALLVVGVGAAVFAYIKGPAELLKLLAHPTIWIVGAVAVLLLAVNDLRNENQQLQNALNSPIVIERAAEDGKKSTVRRQAQRQTRQEEDKKVEEAINSAAPGTAEDAALDEIAKARTPTPRRAAH